MITKLLEKTLLSLPMPADDAAQAYYWDEDDRGFGVVVGRSGQRTFVVRGRANGALVKRTIGVAGKPRPDGRTWSVQLARIEARKVLGTLASGATPATTTQARRSAGPTLREALAFHLEKMGRGENRRGKACSPRSIVTLRGGVELHLEPWLDRPIVDLTADAIDAIRQSIEASTPRTAGANPLNPPGRATANRILANISVIWRSWHKRHGLPVACPVERLTPGALAARDNRISNPELPAWYEKVIGIANHVRRDLQLVALFTGVRTDGVRNLRWIDVDYDDELIEIVRAKGDRPYTLPLTVTVCEILKRRQKENPALMDPFGGDHGYVFPSLARDGKTVIPVAEVKERRIVRDGAGHALYDENDNPVRETYLPGIQACRKTFNSVAIEVGIALEAREALMNHEGRGVNVKSYGFPQNWDYLRECADKVEAGLWARIKGEVRAQGRRRKLKAV